MVARADSRTPAGESTAQTGQGLERSTPGALDFEQLRPEQLRVSSGCVRACASSALFYAAEAAWVVLLLVGGVFVASINRFLDFWAPHYQLHAQLTGDGTLGGKMASDGVQPPGRGVETTLFAVRYGPGPKETADTLLCHDRALAASLPAVLYVHGGGWIAANSASLLHSVAPLARVGHDVYSIDYPLAPRDPFPAPLVSVLRAISWMRTHEDTESVLLFGDSAGGNLVVMAAALVCNPPLLAAFARAAGEPSLSEMPFPHITAVSSMYGIMDQDAWRAPLPGMSWLENKVTHFCVAFAFRLYRSPQDAFDNKFTLTDVLDRVDKLPPLQLICGSMDVLVASNRRAAAELRRRKLSVDFIEHAGERHCFYGFPPAWTDTNGAQRALSEMVAFFKRAEEEEAVVCRRPRKVRGLNVPSLAPSPHPERWYYRNVDSAYTESFLKAQAHHHRKTE